MAWQITDDRISQAGERTYVGKDSGAQVNLDAATEFRLLDDSGEVYLAGVMDDDDTRGDEDHVLAPLRFFEPLLGVTRLEFHDGVDWHEP